MTTKICQYCKRPRIVHRFASQIKNRKFCGMKCYHNSRRGKHRVANPRCGTRLYRIWSGMRRRCNNPSDKDYQRYGGRGINICREWSDFEVFRRWAIANGYEDRLMIERVNNQRGYRPSNCKFANAVEQARNRRSSVYIRAFGERKTMVEWSHDERCTVNYEALIARIRKQGLPAEIAITHPLQQRIKGGKRQKIEY